MNEATNLLAAARATAALIGQGIAPTDAAKSVTRGTGLPADQVALLGAVQALGIERQRGDALAGKLKRAQSAVKRAAKDE